MMADNLNSAKIKEMRIAYPSLCCVSQPDDSQLVWEGILQPIRFDDELSAILTDLENDRAVFLFSGESHEIRHDPLCQLNHGKHPFIEQIKCPDRRFIVRVTDPGDGSLPQTEILDPPIPSHLRKHFLGDGLCAFAPWKYSRNEGIVSFVDHSLIWLLKWNVYSQTDPHIWIGSELDHNPLFLLKNISSSELCWCGSSKGFGNCHLSLTGYSAFDEIWLRLEIWLERHNKDSGRFSLNRAIIASSIPKKKAHRVGR